MVPKHSGSRKEQLTQRLDGLREEESAKFDEYKCGLRQEIELALSAADNQQRRKALRQIAYELHALREPSEGLSRKQLKVVNGALVAVNEVRARTEARPLIVERRMMRRVARMHDHGRR